MIDMEYPKIKYTRKESFELEKFKEMDYYAVNQHHLPIELMMENAGLQLANLIANFVDKKQSILIGIGNGNNGGGGLVAARRLAAWGYTVYLDIPMRVTKELPQKQLERALKYGAKIGKTDNPTVWIDAYLGFSQRLPLSDTLLQRVEEANKANCLRISLDIPTGFLGSTEMPFFNANKILVLAASKKILFSLDEKVDIYIADIGISYKVYQQFGSKIPFFGNQNIIHLIRK